MCFSSLLLGLSSPYLLSLEITFQNKLITDEPLILALISGGNAGNDTDVKDIASLLQI